ncbi:MAG: hypothetical protein PHW46_03955, partial [Candidatus Omnitrophica bacterium]|nr:hypothetical protein [Candidatus Omnitrophota bacterium]
SDSFLRDPIAGAIVSSIKKNVDRGYRNVRADNEEREKSGLLSDRGNFESISQIDHIINTYGDVFNVDMSKIVALNLIGTEGLEKSKFSIYYDEDRLSAAQVTSIRKYIELLKDTYGTRIEANPFSGNNGKETARSLFKVIRHKDQISHEIDIDVNLGGDTPDEYMLKIGGIINLGMVLSTIREGVTKEALQKEYPIEYDFIKRQYKMLCSVDLDLNKFSDITKKIVLYIPAAYKMTYDLSKKYYDLYASLMEYA